MADRFHRLALVVGAGGPGCPALLGFGEDGVGSIRLLDEDRLDLSNRQRQVLREVSEPLRTHLFRSSLCP
jgi:molybdopterin/thiamine biosynthesis adenylyltransferase